MGKFGKKGTVDLNPLSYNIGIAGLSGIGKSTLAYKVCKELVGDEGYLCINIGKEDGYSVLYDAVREDAEDWDKFEEIIDDIVENKTTDYPKLKTVVLDTMDELFRCAEEKVIYNWNKKHPDKKADSINSVAGGFGRGLDAVIELVLNSIWSLKEVGVNFIMVLHTKVKDMEDPISNQTYQVITANMSQKYFNAIKTKLDILGVCFVDRNIIVEKLGRKDIKGKEITRNVVSSEARKIAFRSDDYNLDSKSRFPSIQAIIDLDPDQFIKAITDAIKAEQAKSNIPYEQAAKEQAKLDKAKEERIAKAEAEAKANKELDSIKEDIITFFTENKSNLDVIRPILSKMRELGYSNPSEISNIDDAKNILALTLK